MIRFKTILEEINMWHDEDYDPVELSSQSVDQTQRDPAFLDDVDIAKLNQTNPREVPAADPQPSFDFKKA